MLIIVAALRADARAVDQAGRLADMSRSLKSSHDTTRSKILKDSEGVEAFSESLLSAVSTPLAGDCGC